MSIGSLTYQQLADAVYSTVFEMIANSESTFAYLDVSFKSGYSYTVNQGGGNPSYPMKRYVYTISGNIVSQVSNSTIATSWSNWLESTVTMSDTITTGGLLNFVNNILSWCSRYLCRISNQPLKSQVVIYRDNENSAPKYSNLNADELIYANSINDIIDVITNYINIGISAVATQYSISFPE